MKSIIKFIFYFLILLFVSCIQPIDMVTVINPNGSCYREFTDNADSAFLMGNLSPEHNPFPCVIDSTWEIKWSFRNSGLRTDFPLTNAVYDSIREIVSKSVKLNNQKSKEDILVRVRRNYKSVVEMDNAFKFKKTNEWSKMKVTHSLDKKCMWFFTYYTYREKYSKIETGLELPVENYMTRNESLYWFTGKPNILDGMNGIEAKEYIVKIEEKYNKWLIQNWWNIEYKVLLTNYNLLSKPPVSKDQLKALRDTIFNSIVSFNSDFEMEKTLNEYFKTKAFSELWNKKNSPMKISEDSISKKFTFFFYPSLNYKLVMPGKIIRSDNGVNQGDTLVWKLSSYRMIPSCYTIEAESRFVNIWSFVMTGIILIYGIGCLFWKTKKR